MSKSIKEIKQEFEQADKEKLPLLYEQYADDSRAGVVSLITKYKKKEEKLQAEIKRIEEMSRYERENCEEEYICGIDEVGRGPLAGPVVAGAVILPKDEMILYLNDSKKLSEKKREELYDVIMEKAVATGVGIVSPARIDEINILQATYEAMRMAIGNLKIKPTLLLNDAVTIPEVDIKQIPIIKGDAKSVSIAAASIIAKVTRDRLMQEYDKVIMGYDFASNKGYGSAAHIQALKEKGATPIHRKTFIKNFIYTMRKNTREIGSAFEKQAGEYLETRGYSVIEYNFRCKSGEIDIVAMDGETLVFCEVKYRSNNRKGTPFEAVTIYKQKKICRTALYYITKHQIVDVPCRFDVVGITGDKIEIIKNAFAYIS